MRGGESKRWANITTTSLPIGDTVPAGPVANSFTLRGGYYAFVTVATTYGTVQLQSVAPDGATLLNAGPPTTTNGMTYVYLTAGQYVLTVSGAAGLYATLARIASMG